MQVDHSVYLQGSLLFIKKFFPAMLKEEQPAVFICKKADLGGDLWISQPMRTCVFGPAHEKKEWINTKNGNGRISPQGARGGAFF